MKHLDNVSTLKCGEKGQKQGQVLDKARPRDYDGAVYTTSDNRGAS